MKMEQICDRAGPIIKGMVDPEYVPDNVPVYEHLHVDMNLFSDLCYDSIHAVELVMSLEEEFGVVIDDDTWNEVRTVGDVIFVLCEKHLVPYNPLQIERI